MSSCAASCSICCRRASCASATSASSPTATAPHSCRSASNCSAAQRRQLLRRHHRPPTRFTHSGTVPSAAEPCASSNGSPPPNSCSAHHLNQTGAPHEPLSTSSASARASARTQIPCLNWQKLPPLPASPAPPGSATSSAASSAQSTSNRQVIPNSACPDPSAPAQPHSKYIAFHVGGFLQVAVSEAPL